MERRRGEEDGKEGEEGDLCGFMFQGLKLAPTDVVLTRLWLQHDLQWLLYNSMKLGRKVKTKSCPR